MSEVDIQADIRAIGNISLIPTILEVVCSTTGMGFSAVARVTEDKWVACAVLDFISFGLKPGGELKLETTICNEIRQSGREVVIDHVAEDPDFCAHHTPKFYGFQSYISIPIFLRNGKFFGTLCAIDPRPAQLRNPKTIGMFRCFADLIASHLDNLERLEMSETKLSELRSITELREQFIAILGHDLRNPLSAVSNSAQLLLRLVPDEDMAKLAGIIKNSAFRMKGLIDNMLDFAHGRMGSGIPLNVKPETKLKETLYNVIAELKTVHPHRTITTDFRFNDPIYCDGNRVAQLFSNILGNALAYGSLEEPVEVEATSDKAEFRLAVTNAGRKIPYDILNHIFQPFTRGDVVPGKQGLGLGLYIAAEIARAHSGRLDVVSTDERTCFTLTIPCTGPAPLPVRSS